MTWQCFTKGAGYTCRSSAPGQVTLTKRPGCGSVAASSVISVPSGGGKITFNADINMSGWANQIRMEIVSGTGGIGSGEVVQMINRGVRQSNKAYTVDVSKYAGKNVAFVISSIDRTGYCKAGDHNFDMTIREFKVVPTTITPPVPRESCTEGAKRDQEVCWDGSVIHRGVCVDEMWHSTGETCPTRPPTPAVTCTSGSPHFGSGCALLKHSDPDNDGKVTSRDALVARQNGATPEEVQFILAASTRGSINNLCPGCYTPPPPKPECTEGDKKPGFVCSGGKWVPTVTTPTCPDVTASVTLVRKTDLTVVVDVQTSPSTGWMANDPHLDWGDNKGLRPVSNGRHTHTYATAGRYNIQMGGGLTCGHANGDYIYVDVTAPPLRCQEGAKRDQEVCWDGSVIHRGVCVDEMWHSTDESCPARVCTEGAKRGKEVCWNGHVIYKEVCAGNRWVPTGQTCLDPAPTIRRLQGKIRALEAQVADLQRKITDLKTRYGL